MTERPQVPTGFRCLVIGPIGNSLAPVGTPGREQYDRALESLGPLLSPHACHLGSTQFGRTAILRRGGYPEAGFMRPFAIGIWWPDLTDANPNVMYELALRHVTGNRVISIVEYDTLPLDVGHIRTELFVRRPAGILDARNRLEAAIETVIKEGCDELPVTAIFDRGTQQVRPRPSTSARPTTSCLWSEATEALQPSRIADDASAVGDMGFLDILAEAEDSMPFL